MVDSDDYADLMAASPLDILEYANSYAFLIDIPGLDPDEVRVQVKAGNVLLISSEGRRVEVEGAKYICMERRRMVKFMRKFALPENADAGRITTVSRNGVLTVTVPKKVKVKEYEGELRIGAVDRLSMLPDELLVCILSLLSSKEAAATSILCRRWRHLHTFTTVLDFDGTEAMEDYPDLDSDHYNNHEAAQKFLRWVDGVLKLNRGSSLEKFRVMFYLRQFGWRRIDEWVRFAMSRKVESLELLSPCLLDGKKYYTLDLHMCNYDFNFMKKLSTQSVIVSDEAVEMLLRNCPLLEHVSIADSGELLRLEIIKPFPAFRSLEILLCDNLTSLVIDDSNIKSLKYYGAESVDKVVLVNVPLLTEIWIDGMIIEEGVEDVVEMFSSVLPQLHTLKLRFRSMEDFLINDFCAGFCSYVKMSNLKQLVVDISDISHYQDLLPLTGLIKACPRLQRFVIEEAYDESYPDDFIEAKPIEIPMASSADRMSLKANTQLKEMRFVGYRGVSKHFKLVKHLVENAIALETIVVDPWGFEEPIYPVSFDPIPRRECDDEVFARANALKDIIPFGINVKIL